MRVLVLLLAFHLPADVEEPAAVLLRLLQLARVLVRVRARVGVGVRVRVRVRVRGASCSSPVSLQWWVGSR